MTVWAVSGGYKRGSLLVNGNPVEELDPQKGTFRMTEPREDPDATPEPDDDLPDDGPKNDPVPVEPNADGGDEGERKDDD